MRAFSVSHNSYVYPLQVSVFFQTLMNMGRKSFSHSFAAIAKFHSTLKVMMNASHEYKQTMTDSPLLCMHRH